jgi:CheY-like chemotaxis protein
MTDQRRVPIRVLVVDDEAPIRDAYRQILCRETVAPDKSTLNQLRARLFARPGGAPDRSRPPGRAATFDVMFCDQAEVAVRQVEQALAADQPFSVAFLDMRMPPGRDGVWAAARIRELDPAIEIVICTAYSDVDPSEVGGIVPPD